MSATQIATAEATLTQAVLARRVVAGRYIAGGDDGVRVFYPHVLYRSAAGELLVDVFQVDGPTRGGQLPGWRVLKVAGNEAGAAPVFVLLPFEDERLRRLALSLGACGCYALGTPLELLKGLLRSVVGMSPRSRGVSDVAGMQGERGRHDDGA